MIPYRNAVLTGIAGGGVSPDYDDDAGADTSRWSGSLPIYVSDELTEAQAGQELNQVTRTRLEIPHTIGSLIVRGDTVTYTYAGQSHARTARTILLAPLIGRVRVLVEDE